MKALAEFLPRVLPYVTACPTSLVEQALVDSAIYFCEKSTILRFTPDPEFTVDNQATYDLDLPQGSDFSRVISLKIDDVEISPLPREKLPTVASSKAKPTRYFITQDAGELQLNLYSTPDDAYSITMSLVVRPKRDATSFADELYIYWMDGIVHGALSRIMSLTGQAFSDPMAAMYHEKQASMECHKARVESNMGRVVGSLDVKPRPFVR